MLRETTNSGGGKGPMERTGGRPTVALVADASEPVALIPIVPFLSP
jgi:hypothetical protein